MKEEKKILQFQFRNITGWWKWIWNFSLFFSFDYPVYMMTCLYLFVCVRGENKKKFQSFISFPLRLRELVEFDFFFFLHNFLCIHSFYFYCKFFFYFCHYNNIHSIEHMYGSRNCFEWIENPTKKIKNSRVRAGYFYVWFEWLNQFDRIIVVYDDSVDSIHSYYITIVSSSSSLIPVEFLILFYIHVQIVIEFFFSSLFLNFLFCFHHHYLVDLIFMNSSAFMWWNIVHVCIMMPEYIKIMFLIPLILYY